MSRFQITHLRKTGGPLTKRISLTPDEAGRAATAAPCIMPEGEAHRVELASIDDFAADLQSRDATRMKRWRSALLQGRPSPRRRCASFPERRLWWR